MQHSGIFIVKKKSVLFTFLTKLPLAFLYIKLFNVSHVKLLEIGNWDRVADPMRIELQCTGGWGAKASRISSLLILIIISIVLFYL